jgi:hypothetical protein
MPFTAMAIPLYFQLFLNIIGRANNGDGLMKLQTFEVAKLLILSPEHFTLSQKHLPIFGVIYE